MSEVETSVAMYIPEYWTVGYSPKTAAVVECG